MVPWLLVITKLHFFFFFFFFQTQTETGMGLTDHEQHCTYPKKQATSAASLFIFGDSLFDSGNNNYINTTTLDQANFLPYGETHFHHPTGRFSDGRLLSDFIAEYAMLPVIPPYLQPGIHRFYSIGVNFASAGAGALVETFQGSVINLHTQLTFYKRVHAWLRKEHGHVEAKNTMSTAVYLFSIGTNDYMSPFLTNNFTIFNSYSRLEYVQIVIGNLTTAIEEIHKRGGRKFGFLNLGPLGCLPGLRMLNASNKNDDGCLEEASLLAKLHNKALSEALSKMGKQLEGFKYSLYDFNNNIKKRINHPSIYGFKEGMRACCGTGRFRGTFSCGGKRAVKEFELCDNPNDYVFWDSYHLTERIHKQLAHQMWNVGPYSFKTLFLCL